jgi:hypothetical protein
MTQWLSKWGFESTDDLLGDDFMPLTLDFQLPDTGTGTATLTPVDAKGNPTTLPAGTSVPTWTSSNVAITVTPAADGMSATLTPTALATGVIIAASATLPNGTTITGQGDPIDVVAGPAAGFKMVEAVNP